MTIACGAGSSAITQFSSGSPMWYHEQQKTRFQFNITVYSLNINHLTVLHSRKPKIRMLNVSCCFPVCPLTNISKYVMSAHILWVLQDYPPPEILLSELTVTVEDVTNNLNALDITKASGPDEIPARLLKTCSNEIAPSLCSLFNRSLETARLPSERKMANITSVHKKYSLEPAINYRPISLLCIINKVLERLVGNGLRAQVKHLNTTLQHGFQRNRSCATQLLAVLHEIGKNLDQNVQTDVPYLDFAKAFDTVDHLILLNKLKRFGVVTVILIDGLETR